MSAGHRQAINSKPVQFDENYVIQSYPKTLEERKFLEGTIMNSFIFMDLSSWERNMLLDALKPETVPENTVVIQQGDTGDYFYIVESGSVDYYLGDKPVSEEVEARGRSLKVPTEFGKNVGTCVKGGSFGELALLYDCPRAVSCITSSPSSTLWKVDQQTFRRTVTRHAQKESSELKGLIRKITLFKDLDETTVSRFIHSMTTVFWKEGDRIVQKGEEGTVFYIIKEGTVKCHDIGLGGSTFEDLVLGPGNWFGERAILTGEPRAANVTALSSCTTLAMDRQSFEETIGPLQGLMEREMRKRVLRGLQIFTNSNITDPELDLLVDNMSQVVYKVGEKLAEVGKPNVLKLWLIREGKLAVSSSKNNGHVVLGSGDYYGDKTIKLDDNTKKSTRSATVEEDLVAWVLTRDQIEAVIGDIDRLGRGSITTAVSASADDSMSEHMENLEINVAIPLNDLKYHRILGIGAFGKVWLVEHEPKQSGGFFKKKKKIEVVGPPKVFALKVMSKRKVVEAQLEEAILRERNFLAELRHPFILHLIASYQDDRKLYLLLPLVQGGELFSVLHNNKTKGKGLSNYAASFYGACVIEALGHFHQRKIAYRDLKLENVLIDDKGYGKIVDLGFAKVVEEKTFTLVGTPEYLAPEIIMSKGHDKAADYWAFGILIYELICGRSAFYQKGSSQVEMFKRIVLNDYTTPDYMEQGAKDLIKALLTRRQNKRLGNLANGYLDVKNHPWFEMSGISYKKILRKEAEVPWTPKVGDPLDVSNFDDYSKHEKDRRSSKPLPKKQQEIFKTF